MQPIAVTKEGVVIFFNEKTGDIASFLTHRRIENE